MRKTRSHWTLVQVLERNINRDRGHAPAVSVEADCAAQDMAWMPSADEPSDRDVVLEQVTG